MDRTGGDMPGRAPDPPWAPMRPIVMVGMMGSGKTAVGQALAARLGVPFRDSDDAIEEAARMSVPEIFARDGEPFFRAREAEVVARLLEDGPGVVSTGGGAFLSVETRAAVRRHGISVWLRAEADLLWSRVKGRPGRPLLDRPDARAALAALVEARASAYAKADVVVDCAPHLSIDATAGRVLDALRAAGRAPA